MKRFLIISLVVVATAIPAMARTVAWRVTLSSGDVIPAVVLDRISGDSLIALVAGVPRCFPVESIAELRLPGKQGSFWRGFKKGALFCGLAGLAAGALFSKPGGFIAEDPAIYRPVSAVGVGLLAGALGGTIVGVVGTGSGRDKVVTLSEKTLPEKVAAITAVIHEHQDK